MERRAAERAMNFKRRIKDILGSTCTNPLVRPLVIKSARRTINVAYYHQVGNPGPHYDAFYSGCTVAKFSEDLRQLSQVFNFVSLSEVLSPSEAPDPSQRPKLAITFDDGLDLRPNGVLEILDRYRIKATTFVITSCIGNQRLMWRHALSAVQCLVAEDTLLREYNNLAKSAGLPVLKHKQELMAVTSQWDMRRKDEWVASLWQRCGLPPMADYLAERKPYFCWGDLSEWISAGHSVGFHTHTHPFCSKLQREDLAAEIITPATELKAKLGITDISLSYPFGDRLQPAFERELFTSGLFQALWGIQGSSPVGTSHDKLERFGIESSTIGWGIFAHHLYRAGPRRGRYSERDQVERLQPARK